MSVVRIALLIAGKDLRIERRSRTAIHTATLFAVLVLLTVVFARDGGSVSLVTLAPSVLWITIALASLVALNRAFTLEREHAALEGILLAPVPRSALFLGKWLANLAFVSLVLAITFPLWILFYGVAVTPALFPVAGVAVLASIGITAIGTVFSAMAVRTRHAELLLPVLMLPFLLPPIYFAAQSTVRLLGGRPLEELWGWLRFLALYDLAFAMLAAMLFPAVVDE
ncbi:MAG: heme exporter protein CcmB [Gemmatimonadetes bacterium]|jgi:heme exporter protein B|nr:heme exporter protein CcmB [Gemmatimonadota bacterium]MBK9548063.1 heme exporter protein CcmB [Gemmatimonadota bacterium]MBP6572504.1 heme exporter protein CcmB [Gemmatimonadales bacterium]MBP7621373.1 heme exporter protein CcmB [Gemmatimonadales bacterium]MBP9897548.1 heme exporter protein CcmB [Gemmatimonadales bacterium]